MKKLINCISSMNKASYTILKAGVIISCLILMSALFLLIWAEGGGKISLYELLHIAGELQSLPQAVLILSVILSAAAESIFN